jgi:hypothetical protein
MKITIDTKHDTHEDIRKVLHILTHILENKGTIATNTTLETSNNTEPVKEVNSSNMMSMFANPSPNTETETTTATEPVQDIAPNFNSFLNLVDKDQNEEDENQPEQKIEFF